jgi:hypothetical protein
MSKSVERVKNSGLFTPIVMESKMIAIINAVSLRSRSFFQFMDQLNSLYKTFSSSSDSLNSFDT